MKISTVLVLLVAVASGPFAVPGNAKSNSAPYSITIAAPQNPVKAGSEVAVDIVVTNTSDHEIVVSRSNAEKRAELSGYTVEVWDQKQRLTPESEYGLELKGQGTPAGPVVTVNSDLLFTVQPGKQLKDTLIVSKLRDMSRPGTYTVQVQLSRPETGILAKSNKITVTVIP